MQAEIITIGDEILIGQIVDTNSAYISKELNNIGVSVYQITSVQDDKHHILKALAEAEENADIIIVTGGLGPTKDDITKHTFCEYFNDSLVENKKVLKHVEFLFAKYFNMPISDVNRKQALVPSKAKVLKNRYGTAPGMWMEKNNKVFISLPGVPYEMRGLINLEVLPNLQEKFHFPYILHRTLLTYGLGESIIAARLEGFEEGLPKNFKLAYLPNLGKVRLRLSAKGIEKENIEIEMNRLVKELINHVNDIFIGFEEDGAIEAVIGKDFTKNKLTLSTAESCTGGAISKMLTSVAGASNYFKGSVVAYSAKIKQDVLQVSSKTIDKYSVVSGEVAKEMAINCKKLFQTDYAISTTGNAGPTTDKTDKNVGIVFIAIATPNEVLVNEFNFGQPREKVIQRSSVKSLEMLRKEILKNNKNSL
ncbi:MAG: competence/damage-inducible protein A [Flavobacteriaceae bacterium]|nr:competence/damage-inducible protein A [Flavobacteriaceae bacterium]